MSSAPKYSNVKVVGDAGRALTRAIAAASQSAMEAWEAGRRRRQEQRLEREQSQVRAGGCRCALPRHNVPSPVSNKSLEANNQAWAG
jgi:hypothetical protein